MVFYIFRDACRLFFSPAIDERSYYFITMAFKVSNVYHCDFVQESVLTRPANSGFEAEKQTQFIKNKNIKNNHFK